MTHKFNKDHDNPQDSQLIVALTGSPAFIKEYLQQMIKEVDAVYGKPMQGRISRWNGYADVVTPMWKKTAY